MRALYIPIALALAATGCNQIFGLEGPAAIDAGGPIPTIGFAMPTTLTDEASGVVSIPVLLTEPADREVTVSFSILGGTATDGEDYAIAQELVVIPPGSQAGALEIEIAADQVLEDDETIELALVMPRGAALGLAQQTVTISATVLPRVNFVATTSSTGESNLRQSMMVTLDMPSTIEVTVMVGASGTATNGSDFNIVDNTVTFSPGETSQVVQVDVKHDTLDEDDETAILTLVSADAAIVGLVPSHTLTITDNDNPPTVTLTPSSETVAENVGSTTFTVQLNMPSGKDITVPFTASGSAVVTTDYTYGTSSPVTIPAGAMSAMVTINVVDDVIDDPTKILATTLGSPTNASLGGQIVHTLTITDNEMSCVGPAGTAFQVCYDTAPTANVVVNSNIDTNTSNQCQSTQPLGWTAGGQPAACVIWGVDVTIDSVSASGSRPLVIAATGTITVMTYLDASSRRFPSKTGPGAPSSLCASFVTSPNGSTAGAGGGAGGSFMTIGGTGGDGSTGANGGTPPPADAAEPTVLRAGCPGQRGGNAGLDSSGTAGLAGGAVYLVAGTAITLQNNSRLNASGAGGNSSTLEDVGGSGGGTGGMIRLYAPTITATGAIVLANGGGGSEGSSTSGGEAGSDPNPLMPLVPASGGSMVLGGGNGGSGFATGSAAGSGGNGNNGGGGGGGGGGGLVRSNVALTGATVSAGALVVGP